MSRAQIKRALVRTAYGLGLGSIATAIGDRVQLPQGRVVPRRRPAGSYLILWYHRVNDYAGEFMIDRTSVELFDRQMEWLKQHWNVLPLRELTELESAGRELPPRAVAITFDDGYEDNYSAAFPVLKRHGLPATIFLTVGCIEDQRSLWFDRVLYAFRETRESRLSIPEMGLDIDLTDPVAKRRASRGLLDALKKLPGAERLERVDALLRGLCGIPAESVPHEMLQWEQIREMDRHGIDFGSHTLNHPILTRVSEADAEHELRESRRLMEQRIDRPVTLFAYPNGKPADFSESIKTMLQSSGYRAALTTVQGENTPRTDRLELRRVRPFGRQLPEFALSMAYHHLRSVEVPA